MTHLRQDVREAGRRILQEPGFAALAILTLALGIGANTAMFSVIKTVLLQPLAYGQPERLVMIWNTSEREGTTWLSAQEVASYRRDLQSFELFGAYTEADADLTGGADPERVRGALVTAELFALLQVQPALGRTFNAADDAPGNTVAVVAHGLWQRRFGGASDIVGKEIQVNGVTRTIVGVMPESFELPMDYRAQRATEIWLPFPIDPANLGDGGDRSARRRPPPAGRRAGGGRPANWPCCGAAGSRPASSPTGPMPVLTAPQSRCRRW